MIKATRKVNSFMKTASATEISPLPTGWALVPLGTCCDIVSGSMSYTDFLNIQPSAEGDTVECMGIKVSDMNLLGNERRFVTATQIKHLSKGVARRKLIPPNAVVFPKRGAAIATNKKRLTTAWTVLDPNLIGLCAKDSLDSEFLYYWSQTFDLRKITDPGSTPQLNKKDLVPILMPVPGEIDEQRKIAGVLGVVQRAIEQQEQLLQRTTELKKALLHQLFTHGLRGEPQKETEIGPVPESWEATTLGELACKPNGFLQTGPFGSQLHKHDYVNEGIGVVNPTHLWGNRINHADVPHVSSKTAKGLERHRLEVGDILFARRGEIGRQGLVTKDEESWLCGTGCFLARVRQKHIDNRFLTYLFTTPGVISWLNSHAAGAIMPNLNNTVLRTMPVYYPKVESQSEIANCLDSVEKKLAIYERKKAASAVLFRTLLHQLMTAQTRVNDIDLNDLDCGGMTPRLEGATCRADQSADVSAHSEKNQSGDMSPHSKYDKTRRT